MAITYKIDSVARIIHSHWAGEIALSDLRRHWEALRDDPNSRGIGRVFANLQESTLLFSGADFWSAVDDHFRDPHETQLEKAAILVSDEAQETLARQFAAIVSKTSANRIFYDRTQALAWLTNDKDGE